MGYKSAQSKYVVICQIICISTLLKMGTNLGLEVHVGLYASVVLFSCLPGWISHSSANALSSPPPLWLFNQSAGAGVCLSCFLI